MRRIAESQTRPWYQVRRARTLLGLAAGQRVQTLAEQLHCASRTIGRTCQLYRRQGLAGLLASFHRAGRPLGISPPAACPARGIGVSGTLGEGFAHHPLVERRSG
ncbi:MAG: helix-turn-helix domain-containing protein [Anaerolineales bacterium]|nr:helix-turn-helix domain-containing protein [Anaerolineales bacterium]